MNEEKEKFVPMGTKISPEMAEVWNAVCDSLGTDTYHMLQAFIYAMCRASSPQHALTPEIRKLMTYLETDVAWQHAINLCTPNGKLSISQMILIVEQAEKRGFGMVMLDKPFMGGVRQTECVDDIVERVVEIGVKGIYRRLRQLGIYLGSESIIDTLITMADAQTMSEIDRQNEEEMRGPANYHDYMGAIEYGKRTKRKHRRNIESMGSLQQTIRFTDEDREIADYEAKDWEGEHRGDSADDVVKAMGCKPFDVEP